MASTSKAIIKIGLLLPFHINDDNQTQSVVLGGTLGVHMAVAEINSLEIIPGAMVTLIEKDSYPKVIGRESSAITQAIVSSISLIQEGVVGVIGDISSSWTVLSALMTSTLRIPQCSFSANATSLADKSQYAYFFRTVPTDLLYADAILSFIIDQHWPVFGILYADTSDIVTQTLLSKSKKLIGVGVKSSQTFFDTGDTNNIHASIDTLMSMGSRIVFIASKQVDHIVSVLTIAAHTRHINQETVWITMTDAMEELKATVAQFNDIISTRKGITHRAVTTKPSHFEHAAEQVAWTTKDLELIDFKKDFAGGIFTFVPQTDLSGYSPFDQFNQKWQKNNHVSSSIIRDAANSQQFNYHTGLAYSCMMVMAHGLGQIVKDSIDRNQTLSSLSTGQLPFEGDDMISIFNDTQFMGPQGPVSFDKNGDTTTGNYKIYNVQNGSLVEIGKILGGSYSLFASPVYFDGTNNPPSGTPSITVISSGLSTPISQVTACLAGIGITIATIILILVIIYRNHRIFKSSSPIFCILELTGFILSYVSILVLFSYSDTLFNCFMLPITFYVSLSIILGTMLARNYSVYRIINNVYAKPTSMSNDKKKRSLHNMQLLKLAVCILTVNCFILTLWLIFANVQLVLTSVSTTVSLAACSYDGPGHTAFIFLLSATVGIELCFSTFLAIRTKSFGGYSKYSDHKQLGVSVFNIFFSTLIGFIIFFMPTTDYYTRHYLTAMTILWASTFSMGVLFFPKVYQLLYIKLFHCHNKEEGEEEFGGEEKLNSMKQVLAALDEESSVTRGSTLWSQEDGSFLLDMYQELLPVQYVFRYFPYLARWEMQHIIFFPQVHYLSFKPIEKKEKKNLNGRSAATTVFGYSHATVESNTPGSYVFRVHGSSGFHDLLIQVENQMQLNACCERFKMRAHFKHDGIISTTSTAVEGEWASSP